MESNHNSLSARSLSSGGVPSSAKRRPAACERCNKRRVKCDASTGGTPCSECRRSNTHDCTIVRSKRTRGPLGRYVIPRQQIPAAIEIRQTRSDQSAGPLGGMIHEQQQTSSTRESPQQCSPQDPQLQNATQDQQPRLSLRDHQTAQNPRLPVELSRLITLQTPSPSGGGVTEPGNVEEISQEQEIHTVSEDCVKASFVGESWYAGYLISNSGANHTELHRPMDRRIDAVQGSTPATPPSSTRKGHVRDLPPSHLVERLLEAYFTRFHIFCPILDRPSFLRAVKDDSVSVTLLRCVLFVASIHCDVEICHSMGHSNRFEAGDELFSKACTSFDAEGEDDRTTMILSSYLLHYWFGKPTKYRDSIWWLANAIRSAQGMGYHRSTKNSTMDDHDKSYFKVLWWCLYIRDRQLALSTGVPLVINDLEHDVEDLKREDFHSESIQTADYIIAQASLNQTAASLYLRYCSPTKMRDHNPASQTEAWLDIERALEEWRVNAPAMNHTSANDCLTLILKVCHQFYKINLLQRIQRQDARTLNESSNFLSSVQDAAINISTLVEDSLLHWQPCHFPLIYVSAIFSAMNSVVAGCGVQSYQLLLPKLRSTLLALKQLETCHMTARWIRSLFMDFLQKLQEREKEHSLRSTDQLEQNDDEHNTVGAMVSATSTQLPQRPLTSTKLRQQIGTSNHTRERCSNVEGVAEHQSKSLVPPPRHSSQTMAYSAYAPYNDSFERDPASTAGVRPLSDDPTLSFNISLIDDLFALPDGPSSSQQQSIDQFPSPSTMQFQSMYFLADLGLAGMEDTVGY